jgi:hypothetical protein
VPAQRLETRPPTDRQVDLREAAARVGYASEYLRKLMWSTNPPPFFKVRGRWRVQLSDLDAWATAQGIALLDLPDHSAAS